MSDNAYTNQVSQRTAALDWGKIVHQHLFTSGYIGLNRSYYLNFGVVDKIIKS